MSNPSPKLIAKWFVNRVDREAGDVMTHLKLQKLLYFAQAWHLANFNKPLFDEDMQAWTHGPVVPSVWHEYKHHGWDPIPPTEGETGLKKGLVGFLDAVYRRYGSFSAKELERLTHSHAPWKDTRGDLPLEASCSAPIDKQSMRDFYAAKIGKRWT